MYKRSGRGSRDGNGSCGHVRCRQEWWHGRPRPLDDREGGNAADGRLGRGTGVRAVYGPGRTNRRGNVSVARAVVANATFQLVPSACFIIMDPVHRDRIDYYTPTAFGNAADRSVGRASFGG